MKKTMIKTLLIALMMCLGGSGAWAEEYEILYGVPTYASDGTTITGVDAQGDFTDDENAISDIEFSDANGNAEVMPIGGSVLYANKTGNWTKYFSEPIREGKVVFSANYTVSANNGKTFRIVGNDDYLIFGSAVNTTGSNAEQVVATICGQDIKSFVRLPRNAAYGIKNLSIDLDKRIVNYELLVSSNKNSYSTLTGTIDLPDEVYEVKGMLVANTSYGAYIDNVILYSHNLKNTDYIVDIDFANSITDGVVSGTKGSMSVSGSSINDEGRLVLGKGNNIVDIPNPTSNGCLTFNFKLAYGRLTKRVIGFSMLDSNNNVVGKFEFCPYDGNIISNSFGINAGDMYYSNNTVRWDRYAEFTITYDYNFGMVLTEVYNAYSKKTATYMMPMENMNPIVKFDVYSNYENPDRYCQFDDLKIFKVTRNQVNADIDFSNEISGKYKIAGDVSAMEWKEQWTVYPSIEDEVLRVGNFNGKVNLDGYQIGDRDIVTISFDMMFVGLTRKNLGFYLKDIEGSDIIYQQFDAYSADFDDTNPLELSWDDMYRISSDNPGMTDDNKTHFEIVLNYLNKTITTTTICNKAKNKTATHVVAMPETAKPIGSFVLRSNYNNEGRRCYFDNLMITSIRGEYDNVNKKTVNVTYQDADGNDISSVLPEGIMPTYYVPNNCVFKPYCENILTEESVYTYKSGGEEFQISSDADVVVVYDRRERQKYNLVLNAVAMIDGEETIIAETVYKENILEYNTVKYGYSKYVLYEGVLYEAEIDAADGNYYVNTTTVLSETPIKINYSPLSTIEGETPVYFVDLGGDVQDYYELRYSGGSVVSGSSVELVPANTLEDGFYKIVIQHNRNRKSNIYVGEVNVGTLQTGSDAGVIVTTIMEDVIVSNGNAIIAVANTDVSKATDNIDYVIVYKLSKELPVTITSAGVGTLCSPYNLNFNDATNIAAYKAETKDGKIILTRVYNVAAREGVLIRSLNGGAVTEDIPVSATAFDANEGNEFIGTLVDIASQPSEDEEYRYYILSSKTVNGNKVYGFYLANNKKIGAGKAYLRVPLAAAAKYSFFSFDDETTGVEDVELGITETDSPVYDLFGRKVVNPATGLYIKNGKKFIVK